jgi:hypothetical protein
MNVVLSNLDFILAWGQACMGLEDTEERRLVDAKHEVHVLYSLAFVILKQERTSLPTPGTLVEKTCECND